MNRVITVVLRRDGRHQHTIECSLEDAQRWADEGYTVFRFAARDERWAVNHVNSGKVVTNESPHTDIDKTTPRTAQFLLTVKG
jgi:hypothetical protein